MVGQEGTSRVCDSNDGTWTGDAGSFLVWTPSKVGTGHCRVGCQIEDARVRRTRTQHRVVYWSSKPLYHVIEVPPRLPPTHPVTPSGTSLLENHPLPQPRPWRQRQTLVLEGDQGSSRICLPPHVTPSPPLTSRTSSTLDSGR